MVPIFMIDANDSFYRFVTCPPLPLAYPMSNTALIWLQYEGYNSRHGDYPEIHGRESQRKCRPEGYGRPNQFDVTLDTLEIQSPG